MATLIGRYFHAQEKMPLILVPSRLLELQFRSELSRLSVPEEELPVCQPTHLSSKTKIGTVAIVDEADLSVQEQVFCVKKDAHRNRVLTGLFAIYKCSRVFFLSSSMPAQANKMIEQIFGLQAHQHKQYLPIEQFMDCSFTSE